MSKQSWDEAPTNFSTEFNFHRGPHWLRLLAITPIVDRFAYPFALKKGLGELWPAIEGASLPADFEIGYWIIHESPKNDFERWIEGSMGFLSHKKKYSLTRFLLTQRTIHITKSLVIFWHVFPRFSFTRHGKHLKFQRDIHRLNGTYQDYRRALRGERFDFSE